MHTRYKRKFFDPRYVSLERRRAYVLACILFWSILWFLFVRHFLFATVEVVGPSMQPTLVNGERHLLNRWVSFVRAPKRGSVVAVAFGDEEDLNVKRVIGLPGERLSFSNHAVYVDGHRLAEPYLPPRTLTEPAPRRPSTVKIPSGQYFVMGDNRGNSEDSRHHGPVPRAAVVGRIRL